MSGFLSARDFSLICFAFGCVHSLHLLRVISRGSLSNCLMTRWKQNITIWGFANFTSWLIVKLLTNYQMHAKGGSCQNLMTVDYETIWYILRHELNVMTAILFKSTKHRFVCPQTKVLTQSNLQIPFGLKILLLSVSQFNNSQQAVHNMKLL